MKLSLESIEKRFGATRALRNVSLHVAEGEVVALVGENGAGKSTLMKVLAGIVAPDSGTLRIDGQIVRFDTPRAAMDAGVALIHQELSLHDHLSIAENLYLGREPRRRGLARPLVDYPRLRRLASDVLQQVGVPLDPRRLVGSLPIATKQLIEIARALTMDASILVMDEPTSSLSDVEADRLFGVIERLRASGKAIIYISHRLPEIVRIADRVEVLRDGQNVATLTGQEIAPERMVFAMVGRELGRPVRRREVNDASNRLSVESLLVDHPGAKPISFQVAAGEVVALTGRLGSGRTEIVETIFGIRSPLGGTVSVDGQMVRAGIRSAIAAGIALVPEDRKSTGLLIESNVRDNATLVAMSRAPAAPRLDRQWQDRVTDELVAKLNIKTAGGWAMIGSLSGGNQQKVALAKWLPCEPKVLMLDEPTRGVDIGAKAEIYELIDNLVRDGLAVLVVSSELEEIEALADRVVQVGEG